MPEHSSSSEPAATTNGGMSTLHEANKVRVTVEQAKTFPIPAGQRSAPVLTHGSLLVKFYAM